MNIEELKENILNRKVNDSLFIFKSKESSYIPNSYALEISKVRNKEIKYASNLNECKPSRGLFGATISDYLYVVHFDKLDEFDATVSELRDTIIICKDIKKDILDIVKDCVVDFPTIEKWQVVDFMKKRCNGVGEDEIEWLSNIADYNVERLDNEASKIEIFDRDNQQKIFNELSANGGYEDLTSYTIFNLTDAITKNDILSISNILKDIRGMDVDGIGLSTILYKNFKNIIGIQLGKNVTAETLGITPKQYNAIKYKCGSYSGEKLVKINYVLSSMDSLLKSGKLPQDNDRLIDYIICNILS